MSALADQTRWMDATDQAALIASGEVSPSELLEAAIERIERIDPALNAVVIRWFDHARETAASADLPNGPFRGVPFLIKDLFATYAGQRISNGNVAFKEAHVIADADTTLVSRAARDTAALLDVPCGPGMGDTAIAPPPARPNVEELGADAGRLRIGIIDHHPQGGRVDAEVTHAAQAVGKLLESLGRHFEPAWPKALEDKTFGSKFGALWSPNMGISRRRFKEQLGRPLASGTLKPMTRGR